MLPDFDQEAIGAKYKGVNKEPMDQAETAVWDKIQELAVRFQQADRIVLGVPMWNFARSEEHTSELQSLTNLVCRLLLEKKKHEANPGRARAPWITPLAVSAQTRT